VSRNRNQFQACGPSPFFLLLPPGGRFKQTSPNKQSLWQRDQNILNSHQTSSCTSIHRHIWYIKVRDDISSSKKENEAAPGCNLFLILATKSIITRSMTRAMIDGRTAWLPSVRNPYAICLPPAEVPDLTWF